MTDGCPLCKSVLWSKDLSEGNKTVKDAMIAFHMTEADVILHMTRHSPPCSYTDVLDPSSAELTKALVRPTIDAKLPVLRKNPTQEEVTEYLYTMVGTVQNWLETLMRNDPFLEDRGNVDMLLKVTDRIFKGIEQATKIQGIVIEPTSKVTNNYVQVQGNLNMFRNILIQEMCPECRRKLLPKIQELTESEQ